MREASGRAWSLLWTLGANTSPCLVEGCEEPARSHGYCFSHGRFFKLYGDPLVRKIAPRGSGTINAGGYRVFEVAGRKTEREHRRVMAEHLGRELLSSEIVHHKGGKLENVPELLEVTNRSDHAKLHHPPTITCKSGHPWEPETTYWSPDGKRHCRICQRRWGAEKRVREKTMHQRGGSA